MTKADIIAEYKQAKNRRAQITILADQNLVSEQEIVDILKAGGCEVPTYKYRTTAGSTKNRAPRKKADSLVDSAPYQDQRKPETAVNNEPKLCFGTYTPPNPLDDLDRYIQGIIDCARLIKEWCGDG